MNVLWTRLSETGRNWRYVYKVALAVIEYLVANGSERAVDDIIEHTFQISSLATFEHVEPNGKDMGINVRKKVETIVALLNNKDKIQEVRNKAAANREKYFGLSSSGITYKSGSFTSGSSSFHSGDRYGGFSGTKDSDTFKDSYKDNDQVGEEKFDHSTSTKSRVNGENQVNTSKKGSTRHASKGQNASASGASKSSTTISVSAPTHNSTVHSNDYEDDFDDFDPRGTSTAKSADRNSKQVDLFGQNLLGDLMDAPASVPNVSTMNSNVSEVDLFADATFVSAPTHVESGGSLETQTTVDLFASQPASSSAVSSSIDFFAAPSPTPIAPPNKDSSKSDTMNTSAVDPFAAVPLNSFDGSDLFGAFASNADQASTGATKNSNDTENNWNGNSSAESMPPPKKDTFQVKSGIWADSLSRGLIDLNISARKLAFTH
ncbi:hypothetical protein U1Q18_021727 [Sarracenia purpurea var. burkii]